MTRVRFRPIVRTDRARPGSAPSLAGGPLWFEFCERLARGEPPEIVKWSDIDAEVFDTLVRPRTPVLGLALTQPHVVGVLNVTPDSFSDGGRHFDRDVAARQAMSIFSGRCIDT